MKSLGLLFLAGMFTLTGCGETIHDIEFYKTNESERITKLDWCKGSAERRAEINCKNATSARAQISNEKVLPKW